LTLVARPDDDGCEWNRRNGCIGQRRHFGQRPQCLRLGVRGIGEMRMISLRSPTSPRRPRRPDSLRRPPDKDGPKCDTTSNGAAARFVRRGSEAHTPSVPCPITELQFPGTFEHCYRPRFHRFHMIVQVTSEVTGSLSLVGEGKPGFYLCIACHPTF
jgi:hypothetical protein